MNQDEIVEYLCSAYPRSPQDPSAPAQFTGLSPAIFEGHDGYRLDHTNGAGESRISLVSIDVTKGELDDLMTSRS